MRTIIEIMADIKNGIEVPPEEMKATMLMQNYIIFKLKRDVSNLLRGGAYADAARRKDYSDPETSNAILGISTWLFKAYEADPLEYLPSDMASLITGSRT